MKKLMIIFAVVLSATTAFADDHCREKSHFDNGHHYGRYGKHDRHRGDGCRSHKEVATRYVVYRPEYRSASPRLTVALQTPELIISFLSGR